MALSYDLSNLGFVQKELMKYFFLTYISAGIFKGFKHEFNEEGVCVLSGINREDILKKNITVEEYDNLVTFIITKNSVQIDTKKVLERNDDAINELKNESQNFLDKEIDSFV